MSDLKLWSFQKTSFRGSQSGLIMWLCHDRRNATKVDEYVLSSRHLFFLNVNGIWFISTPTSTCVNVILAKNISVNNDILVTSLQYYDMKNMNLSLNRPPTCNSLAFSIFSWQSIDVWTKGLHIWELLTHILDAFLDSLCYDCGCQQLFWSRTIGSVGPNTFVKCLVGV